MSEIPLINARVITDFAGDDTATSSMNTFTAGSGSKGSWNELVATTANETHYMIVALNHEDTGIEEFLIDIGIGAAASEQVVIENMPWSGQRNFHPIFYMLPVRIPSGVRVSIRAQGTTARSLKASLRLLSSSFQASTGFSGAKGYGINSGASRGIVVDPGGTAHTKGSWAELDASTDLDIKGFNLHIGGNDNAIINATTDALFDIAVGGSGSEEIIVPNHWCKFSTGEDNNPVIFYDIFIPSGTRISARQQSSNTDAADRLKTVTLVGVN